MSERETNERRKIKRGSISGLADTTMKVAASQYGQGPTELETQAAVLQQADASQEGRGPEEPETKATVPQQADASQEGQGPEELETKATVPQQADASQEGQRPDRAQDPPFNVEAMWHDGQFTYLRSHAQESPALYEAVDGDPTLVAYDLTEDGLYIVRRILDSGWLQIGKRRAIWRYKPER